MCNGMRAYSKHQLEWEGKTIGSAYWLLVLGFELRPMESQPGMLTSTPRRRKIIITKASGDRTQDLSLARPTFSTTVEEKGERRDRSEVREGTDAEER